MFNAGPEKMAGAGEGLVNRVKCPCCKETVMPMWDGADGIWICPNDYEDIDDLVEDLSSEDK